MKYPYFLALTIAAFAGASMLLIGLHEGIQIREEIRNDK